MNDTNSKLLRFLTRLKAQKIFYSLEHVRDEAIMVLVAVPGERWEIEFMDSGEVEVEIFKSNGSIHGNEALIHLFEKYSD